MKRIPLKRIEAGLPAHWYYDDAQYKRELEAFWYRGWIAACRQEEIPSPGDWRAVPIGSQEILVLRNETGELRAFHNTCRHRGSILCEKQSGKFARGRIVCPYHAWTYDLEGRLAETLPPNLFLNIQPDYVNSHMMFPTGPQSVRIVYDWLFEPRHLPLSDTDLRHYVALWEVTNAQDARNCEWQQRGIHALPFEHGHYVPQEFDAHRFAQWVRQGLSGKTASRPRRARKAAR